MRPRDEVELARNDDHHKDQNGNEPVTAVPDVPPAHPRVEPRKQGYRRQQDSIPSRQPIKNRFDEFGQPLVRQPRLAAEGEAERIGFDEPAGVNHPNADGRVPERARVEKRLPGKHLPEPEPENEKKARLRTPETLAPRGYHGFQYSTWRRCFPSCRPVVMTG